MAPRRSAAQLATRPSARQDMIVVAERLFGERGLHAVSMREVVTAAGQRNNSAVEYHFGGRDGLVRAVFTYRMRDINAARWALLRQLDEEGFGRDVRSLVQAYLLPLADFLQSAPEGCHYAQFLSSAVPFTDFADPELREVTAAVTEVARRLGECLTQLPAAAAKVRVQLVFTMLPGALAVHEQRAHAGLRPLHPSFAALVADVIDAGVGALNTGATPVESP